VAKRTAFVFAGGGSLGAVQVGMLRALAGFGVVPDLVIGASVGAINAAYYAGANTPEGIAHLEAVWGRIRRQDVFRLTWLSAMVGLVRRGGYLVDPLALSRLLQRHLPYTHLEHSRVPCHVVATDVLTGHEAVLSSGAAVAALRASTAIPGLLEPVTLDGRVLVDGGVANNTPISTAVELGAMHVIVLPTGFPCAAGLPPAGPIALALHALNLLVARQLVRDTERFRAVVHVSVVPPLCPLPISSYDFSHGAELIERAAVSTTRWIQERGLEREDTPPALLPHSHARVESEPRLRTYSDRLW
jgi:NTE family protein